MEKNKKNTNRLPPRAGMGRPKGSKNKVSNDLRQYVMDVAEKLEIDGKGLYEWAKENPTEYWGKVFKAVVPKEVTKDVRGNITITWEE